MPEIKFFVPMIGYIITGLALCFGAYTDYKTRMIPNSMPLVIFLCGCLTPSTIISQLLNLAAMILILLVLSKVCHYKSGGGDIKIYLSLTFLLGLVWVAAILCVTLALHLLVELIRRKKKSKGETIPLCTYVAPAYIIVWGMIFALQFMITAA